MTEPEVVHVVMPVWQSMSGQRYCSNHTQHGEWVIWPCEEAPA